MNKFLDYIGLAEYTLKTKEYIDSAVSNNKTEIEYTIKTDLTNCSLSNSDTVIKYGESYEGDLSFADDYKLSELHIICGGLDITSESYNSGHISIDSVNGNLYICAKFSTGFSIDYNLTNITSSNKIEVIDEGSEYSTELVLNEGCENPIVNVTMNGEDITESVVEDLNIIIPNVTGNIIITAAASVKTFTVSEEFTDGVTLNYPSSINYGDDLQIECTVDPNYELYNDKLIITVNGVSATFTKEGNIYTITNVKGDVSISADGSRIYNVEYALRDVESSNTELNARDDMPYTTTLTFDTDVYSGVNVTIMMGGVNITETAWDYSTGIITINNPSGDITISAEASTVIIADLENVVKLSDSEWKFNLLRENSSENFSTSTAMLAKNYDDSSWETVMVPHDWSIYKMFTLSNTDYESGFLPGGDAIYRKEFTISSDDFGKRHYIYFDGVYMTSEVFINGTSVGTNKYGYAPFKFDITDQLVEGTNVVAVTVSNRVPTSRYYSGSGIFRSVYLICGNSSEIGEVDCKVEFPNLRSEYNSSVNTVCNLSIDASEALEATVTVNIYQLWDNVKVAENADTIQLTEGTNNASVNVYVNRPTLWETHDRTDSVKQYYAEVNIAYDNKVYYSDPFIFGYRWVTYESDGIYLNGSRLWLKGMSMHHDMGAYGAGMNKSAYYRQLTILKEAGINALRCCHNPFAKEYYDMCAEFGIVTIEEFYDGWHSAKNSNTYDYARFFSQSADYREYVIRNIIKRDKNNPSIIMWSLGNEVSEGASEGRNSVYVNYCQELNNYVKKYDTTRGTTYGENKPTDSYAVQMMNIVDVIGVNYGNDSEYSSVRSNYPSKCIYGSETSSPFYSRNYYTTNTGNYIYSSYDTNNSEEANSHASWGDSACTALTRNRDTFNWIGGEFPWTGFDYIGEPTPSYAWPTRSSNFGIVDLCGFPKDAYYMYMAEWTSEPMVHICPMDWTNYTEGNNVKVWLYSNCHHVELFLNGQSVGSKTRSELSGHFAFEYQVPFANGTLVANAYDTSNHLVALDVIYSASSASSILLTSDKTQVAQDGTSLIFVDCSIVDKFNTLIPRANNQVTFSCVGGQILATDNGYPACQEAFRNSVQTCFGGKCGVIVLPDYASENVVITAISNGLNVGSITVRQGTDNIYYTKTTDFIDATNPPIKVNITNVVLDHYALHVDNGQTGIINIITNPVNAAVEVLIQSDNDNVTAVCSDKTISITSTENNAHAFLTIDVSGFRKLVEVGFGTTTVEELDLSQIPDTIYLLQYLRYTLEALSRSGYLISSSNESILSVNNATIGGVSPGKANIIVTAPNGVKFEKEITVQAHTSVTDAVINSFYVLNYDATTDNITNGYNIIMNVNRSATIGVVFEFEPSVVVTSIGSGSLVPYGVSEDGTRNAYMVSFTGDGEGDGKELAFVDMSAGKHAIYLRSKTDNRKWVYNNGSLPCTSVTLDVHNLNIDSDAANGVQIVATILPENTTDDIVWSGTTNNSTYVGGYIIATRNGNQTVTCTCGSQSDSCEINISNVTEDSTLLLANVENAGSKTLWWSGSWNGNTDTMYAEFTLNEVTGTSLLWSWGLNISNWTGTHYHIYYPTNSNDSSHPGTGICMAAMNTGGTTTYVTDQMLGGQEQNVIRVCQNKYGVFINGIDAGTVSGQSSKLTAINNLTTQLFGCLEGGTLFNGVLNEFRIIHNSDLVGVSEINATMLRDLSINGNAKRYTMSIPCESMQIIGKDEITSLNTSNYIISYVPATTTELDVTWSIAEGEDYASINAEGKVLVKPTATSAQTVVIRATNNISTSVIAEKTITVVYDPANPIGYSTYTLLSKLDILDMAVNETKEIVICNGCNVDAFIIGNNGSSNVTYNQVTNEIVTGNPKVLTTLENVYEALEEIMADTANVNNFIFILTKTSSTEFSLELKNGTGYMYASGTTANVTWSTNQLNYTLVTQAENAYSGTDIFPVNTNSLYRIKYPGTTAAYLSSGGAPSSLRMFTNANSAWGLWMFYELS